MKKVLLVFTIVMMFLALIGADIRRTDSSSKPAEPRKKKCLGYTIIEFGKGIDCNGDTVKLVRVNGVQVLASSIASK
jgi:hypothetical protein